MNLPPTPTCSLFLLLPSFPLPPNNNFLCLSFRSYLLSVCACVCVSNHTSLYFLQQITASSYLLFKTWFLHLTLEIILQLSMVLVSMATTWACLYHPQLWELLGGWCGCWKRGPSKWPDRGPEKGHRLGTSIAGSGPCFMSVESCLWTRALQRANLEWVWPWQAWGVTAARQLCECGRHDNRLLLFTDLLLHPFSHYTNIDWRLPVGSALLCVPGTNCEWPLFPIAKRLKRPSVHQQRTR